MKKLSSTWKQRKPLAGLSRSDHASELVPVVVNTGTKRLGRLPVSSANTNRSKTSNGRTEHEVKTLSSNTHGAGVPTYSFSSSFAVDFDADVIKAVDSMEAAACRALNDAATTTTTNPAPTTLSDSVVTSTTSSAFSTSSSSTSTAFSSSSSTIPVSFPNLSNSNSGGGIPPSKTPTMRNHPTGQTDVSRGKRKGVRKASVLKQSLFGERGGSPVPSDPATPTQSPAVKKRRDESDHYLFNAILGKDEKKTVANDCSSRVLCPASPSPELTSNQHLGNKISSKSSTSSSSTLSNKHVIQKSSSKLSTSSSLSSSSKKPARKLSSSKSSSFYKQPSNHNSSISSAASSTCRHKGSIRNTRQTCEEEDMNIETDISPVLCVSPHSLQLESKSITCASRKSSSSNESRPIQGKSKQVVRKNENSQTSKSNLLEKSLNICPSKPSHNMSGSMDTNFAKATSSEQTDQNEHSDNLLVCERKRNKINFNPSLHNSSVNSIDSVQSDDPQSKMSSHTSGTEQFNISHGKGDTVHASKTVNGSKTEEKIKAQDTHSAATKPSPPSPSISSASSICKPFVNGIMSDSKSKSSSVSESFTRPCLLEPAKTRLSLAKGNNPGDRKVARHEDGGDGGSNGGGGGSSSSGGRSGDGCQEIVSHTSLQSAVSCTKLSDDALGTMDKDCLSLSSWGLPGPVLEAYHSQGIKAMFPWQAQCLATGHVLEGGNLVYSAPTSAGKTMVAELLILKRVLETRRKALVILPFVSVTREKMISLQKLYQDAGVRVGGFMGGHSPVGGLQSVDVAVCTIEKGNGLVNRLMEDNALHTLGVVVIDELHMVGDSSRGYLLELLLTKLAYMSQRSRESNEQAIQVIGMSATLPNLDVLASWLHADLYRCDFRPVPLTEHIKVGATIYDHALTKVRDLEVKVTFQGDEDYIIPLCLETIMGGHSVLIFCPTKAWCERMAEKIAREFYAIMKNPTSLAAYTSNNGFVKASEMAQLPIDQGSLRNVVEQLARSPVGVDPMLGRVLQYAVAYHHAGLTFDERDIVEGAFRQGLVKILVATSTLSSGVNLPARRVIVRSPLFGGRVINTLAYKQMAGRAGRKGVDTEGECVLVCKEGEKNMAQRLLKSQLPSVTSCLHSTGEKSQLSRSMKRAILEVVVGGVASTPDDVARYVSCTLLSATLADDDTTTSDTNTHTTETTSDTTGSNTHTTETTSDTTGSNTHATETTSDTTTSLITACLAFLEDNEFVTLTTVNQGDTTESKKYQPTQLGSAVLASSMSPDEGLAVFAELQKARQAFVLSNELHIVYLVTPLYSQEASSTIDWYHYYCLWDKLSPDMRLVAGTVGVEESFLAKAISGYLPSKTPAQARALAVHRRFYMALALHELVQEVPLMEVATKYNCNKGQLQALMQSAATFAGMVTVFCARLGWTNMELLFAQFQQRLTLGVTRELCDLVRIPLLTGSMARMLFNAGYHTVTAIAHAQPQQVETIFRNASPFQSNKKQAGETDWDMEQRRKARCVWLTGRKGVTELEAATAIINEAKTIIQQELGVKINWGQGDEDDVQSHGGADGDLSVDRTVMENGSHVAKLAANSSAPQQHNISSDSPQSTHQSCQKSCTSDGTTVSKVSPANTISSTSSKHDNFGSTPQSKKSSEITHSVPKGLHQPETTEESAQVSNTNLSMSKTQSPQLHEDIVTDSHSGQTKQSRKRKSDEGETPMMTYNPRRSGSGQRMSDNDQTPVMTFNPRRSGSCRSALKRNSGGKKFAKKSPMFAGHATPGVRKSVSPGEVSFFGQVVVSPPALLQRQVSSSEHRVNRVTPGAVSGERHNLGVEGLSCDATETERYKSRTTGISRERNLSQKHNARTESITCDRSEAERNNTCIADVSNEESECERKCTSKLLQTPKASGHDRCGVRLFTRLHGASNGADNYQGAGHKDYHQGKNVNNTHTGTVQSVEELGQNCAPHFSDHQVDQNTGSKSPAGEDDPNLTDKRAPHLSNNRFDPNRSSRTHGGETLSANHSPFPMDDDFDDSFILNTQTDNLLAGPLNQANFMCDLAVNDADSLSLIDSQSGEKVGSKTNAPQLDYTKRHLPVLLLNKSVEGHIDISRADRREGNMDICGNLVSTSNIESEGIASNISVNLIPIESAPNGSIHPVCHGINRAAGSTHSHCTHPVKDPVAGPCDKSESCSPQLLSDADSFSEDMFNSPFPSFSVSSLPRTSVPVHAQIKQSENVAISSCKTMGYQMNDNVTGTSLHHLKGYGQNEVNISTVCGVHNEGSAKQDQALCDDGMTNVYSYSQADDSAELIAASDYERVAYSEDGVIDDSPELSYIQFHDSQPESSSTGQLLCADRDPEDRPENGKTQQWGCPDDQERFNLENDLALAANLMDSFTSPAHIQMPVVSEDTNPGPLQPENLSSDSMGGISTSFTASMMEKAFADDCFEDTSSKRHDQKQPPTQKDLPGKLGKTKSKNAVVANSSSVVDCEEYGKQSVCLKDIAREREGKRDGQDSSRHKDNDSGRQKDQSQFLSKKTVRNMEKSNSTNHKLMETLGHTLDSEHKGHASKDGNTEHQTYNSDNTNDRNKHSTRLEQGERKLVKSSAKQRNVQSLGQTLHSKNGKSEERFDNQKNINHTDTHSVDRMVTATLHNNDESIPATQMLCSKYRDRSEVVKKKKNLYGTDQIGNSNGTVTPHSNDDFIPPTPPEESGPTSVSSPHVPVRRTPLRACRNKRIGERSANTSSDATMQRKTRKGRDKENKTASKSQRSEHKLDKSEQDLNQYKENRKAKSQHSECKSDISNKSKQDAKQTKENRATHKSQCSELKSDHTEQNAIQCKENRTTHKSQRSESDKSEQDINPLHQSRDSPRINLNPTTSTKLADTAPLLLPKSCKRNSPDIIPTELPKACEKNSPDIIPDLDSPPLTQEGVSPTASSLCVIDVCASSELFATFVAEWRTKTSFALSLACEKIDRHMDIGAGIGAQFVQGTAKTPASESSGQHGLCIAGDQDRVIVGVAVSWADYDAYYISLAPLHTDPDSSLDDTLAPLPCTQSVSQEHRLQAVREILQQTDNSSSQHTVVVYDAKTTYTVMVRGLQAVFGRCQDPLIACWLLDPGAREKTLHSMVTNYLPVDLPLLEGVGGSVGYGSLGAMAGKRGSGRMRAVVESIVARRLMDEFWRQLTDVNLLTAFTHTEMPSVRTLARMDLNGFGFSEEECESQKNVMMAKLSSLEQEAYSLAGHPFSLTSTDDIAQILYLELQLPVNGDPSAKKPTRTLGPNRRAPRGRQKSTFSTSKDILEKLKVWHPLPAVVLEWRRISGALTKHVYPLQQKKEYCARVDMFRIFSESQMHTATGRVSMIDPNLQNIPKDFDIVMPDVIGESPPAHQATSTASSHYGGKGSHSRLQTMRGVVPQTARVNDPSTAIYTAVSMRHAFIPFTGGVILAADYSQLELRVIAHLSGDKKLISILNNDGDVFKLIAAQWKNTTPEAVTTEERQHAKQICYGMLYGIGAKALGEQIGVEENDAAVFIESFKAKYTGMRQYLRDTVAQCREQGYVTTVTGRRRYLPAIKDNNPHARAQAERQAVNTTVQGSAADIVKKAMNVIDRELCQLFPLTAFPHRHYCAESRPLHGAFLTLQLHDELIYEVSQADLHQVAPLIKRCMETTTSLHVRLPVKVKVGPSWGRLTDMDLS